MKVYHGTALSHLPNILVQGVQPRRETKAYGNWEVHSNADAVYLTDCYGIYFARHASEKDDTNVGVVLEIETEALEPNALAFDEDVLEQFGRKTDLVPGDVKQRTSHYRSVLRDFTGLERFRESLGLAGTASYLGGIPASAITRYATIAFNDEEQAALRYMLIDTSPAATGFVINGPAHRLLTRWLFEGTFPSSDLMNDDEKMGAFGLYPLQERLTRSGVEVIFMNK